MPIKSKKLIYCNANQFQSLFTVLTIKNLVHLQPTVLTEPRRRPKQSPYQSLQLPPVRKDSINDLPLPPTPKNAQENPYRYETISTVERKPRTSTNSLSSSSSSKRSQSQPPHSLTNGTLSPSGVPNGTPQGTLGPSIDREKKPSRVPKDSGLHTFNHQKPSKMTIYDAYASPTSAASSGLYSATGRYHRSQSQIPYDDQRRSYSNGDHSIKPMHSNPVPPPKPKSYPNNGGRALGSHMASTSFVESNYMNSLPQNYKQGDEDSGQGSSLDQRDYGIYNNEPRYANPPGPYSMDYHYGQQNGHNRQNGHHNGHAGQNGLDLTNNREYRGSAFELYKKPLSMRNGNSPPSANSNSQRYHNTNSVW